MVFIVYQHQRFKFLYEKLEIQQIHYALDELESEPLLNQNTPIWVHHGAALAYIFYTQISPKKNKCGPLVNRSKILSWDTDYAKLSAELRPGEPFSILMTNYFPKEKFEVMAALKDAILIENIDEPG